MRSPLRIVGTAAAAALAVVIVVVDPVAPPAGADSGTAGAGSGGGTVTVGAGTGSGSGGGAGGSSGGGPTSGSGSASPWQCTYTYLALNNDGGFPPGGPLPGAWYSVTCDDATTGAQVTQTVWVTGAPPAAVPQVDPHALAIQAEQSMTLSDPTLLDDPAGSSVVGLATWLWIDPSLWHDDSVTATAGGVSATAVARPVGVTWTTGDGSQVACGGPGVPYATGVPSAWQTTYCSHTYVTTAGLPYPPPSSGRCPGQRSAPRAAGYCPRSTRREPPASGWSRWRV